MSAWRPEDWNSQTDTYFHYIYKEKVNPQPREIFEAGADAMLGAICEEIEKVDLPKYKKSWIVMTPEDTRQKILDHLRSNNEYD